MPQLCALHTILARLGWHTLPSNKLLSLRHLESGFNAVAPGPVDTAMAKAVHTPEIRAAYHDAIPLNRYGLEHELAEVIFFLCSDRAGYITGQTIAVDGGFEATGIGTSAACQRAYRTQRGQRSAE